jgi:co-chaperonin GroES (HSP10)
VKYRPLRGRIVIRPMPETFLIYTPDPRQETTHRGEVIDAGPPVLTEKGAEIPLHFKVGDVVQYHFEATEKGRTTNWNGQDGVLVMAQREIDAVVE